MFGNTDALFYTTEQTLGGIPLGFGIVVEDKPSELSCTFLMPIEQIYMY